MKIEKKVLYVIAIFALIFAIFIIEINIGLGLGVS